MAKRSAGLLLYRRKSSAVEVLLVHPGGPFWRNKDLGTWTIPKGEIAEGETPLEAAKREFQEETGLPPGEPLIPLGEIRQAGGKFVTAWAFEGDCIPSELFSNTFEMEWPPRSGKMATFPEIEKAEWFSLREAELRILASQIPLLHRLMQSLP